MSGRILRRRRKVQYIMAYSPADSDFQVEESNATPSASSEFTSRSDGGLERKKFNQKRRKIRKTQDFQNVNESFDDIDTQSRITGTKVTKSKKTSYLPQICDVSEEYDILRSKLMKNKKRKRSTAVSNEADSKKRSELKCDTSVDTPSEDETGNHNENMAKPKNANRKNGRKKVIKFSESDEIITSVNGSDSDIIRGPMKQNKRRQHSDAGNQCNEFKQSTSDSSDSVIYSSRRKQNATAKNDELNILLSPPEEDSSIEYNFKSRHITDHLRMSTSSGKIQENHGETSMEDNHSQVTSTVSSQFQSVETKIHLKESEHSREDNDAITSHVDESKDNSCMSTNSNSHSQNDDSIVVMMKESKNSRHSHSAIHETFDKQNAKNIIQIENGDLGGITRFSLDINLSPTKSANFSQKGEIDLSERKDVPENIKNRRDTYELDVTVNDETALKSFVIENSECSSVKSEKNKINRNLSDVSFSLGENSLNRKTFEFGENTTNSVSRSCTQTDATNLKKNEESFFVKKHILKRTDSITPFSKVTRRRKIDSVANEPCITREVSINPPDDTKLIDDISPPVGISLLQSSDDSSADGNAAKIENHVGQSLEKMPSFGVSSTPLPKREGTYTVLREQSVNKNISRIHTSTRKQSMPKNGSSSKKPETRTKMPNFSLIHQKAFEKMENLEEFQQRKTERAKLLLSGAKPILGYTPRKKSPQNKKVLKQLSFGTGSKISDATDKIGTPRAICLPPSFSVDSPKILPSKIATVKSKVKPVFDFNINQPNKERNILKTAIREISIKPVNSGKASFKPITSENLKPFTSKKHDKECCTGGKTNALKPSLKSNLPLLTGGFTRYGFKTSNASKTITKQEQIKAVANKNKIIKNKIEERRNVIQGVRSNRRFELLMKMRNKT